MEKTKISIMEKGVIDLLAGGNAVWIPDEKVDMSVFAEYPKEKEGIAVYYPIFKDGSCAEATYIRFYRSANGMSLQRASVREYAGQEKERIGHFLRLQ
jgi:hypothetical protein